MIRPPERSAARDAAIDLILPHVPGLGWTARAIQAALGQDGSLLFPGGAGDMVEAYIDLADRRMEAHAVLEGKRLTDRVRTLIETRLDQARDQKAAVRRASLLLAQPFHAGLAARCTARTVDTIWHAAGDSSADFAWYTKRAILAGVYTSTLFYWMDDRTTDEAARAFLDRRLRDAGRLGKMRGRIEGLLGQLAGARHAS